MWTENGNDCVGSVGLNHCLSQHTVAVPQVVGVGYCDHAHVGGLVVSSPQQQWAGPEDVQYDCSDGGKEDRPAREQYRGNNDHIPTPLQFTLTSDSVLCSEVAALLMAMA